MVFGVLLLLSIFGPCSPCFVNSTCTEDCIEQVVLKACNLVYDLSGSLAESYRVKQLSNRLNLVHALAWDFEAAKDLYSIYPHASRASEVKAIQALIKKSPKLLLISEDQTLVDAGLPRGENFYSSKEIGDDFKALAIVLHNTGERTVIIDLNPEAAMQALKGLEQAYMLEKGYLIILTSKAWGCCFEPHQALIVAMVEEGLELLDCTQQMEQFTQQRENLNYVWLKESLKLIEIGIDPAAYLQEVLNERSFGLYSVASNTSSSTPLSIETFNSLLDFSLTERIPIQVAAFDGNTTELSYQNCYNFKGFYFGVNYLDSNLGRFKIVPKGYDCLIKQTCEAETSTIAGVTPFSSEKTIYLNEARALRGLPLIGCQNLVDELSNSVVFPRYVRVNTSNRNMAFGIVKFMQAYGYTKVNLVYSNETFGIDFANNVKKALKNSDFEVTTPEHLQPIGFTQGKVNEADFNKTVMELQHSATRLTLFLIISGFQNATLNALANSNYDSSQFVNIFQSQLNNVWQSNDPMLSKREALVLDNFVVTQATFIGSYGTEIKKALKLYLKELGGSLTVPRFDKATPCNSTSTDLTQVHCKYYDAVYFLVTTLERMLRTGKDFRDRELLMKQLRLTQIVGCTGFVRIYSSSNDRRDMDVQMLNIQRSDLHLTEVIVWTASQSSIFLLKSQDEIFDWEPPSDLRLNNMTGCFYSFVESDHRFEKGVRLLNYICASFGLVAAVFALGVMLFNKKVCADVLKEEFYPSIQDLLHSQMPRVKLVQYVAFSTSKILECNSVGTWMYYMSLMFLEDTVSTRVFIGVATFYLAMWSVLTLSVVFCMQYRPVSQIMNYFKLWLPLLHEVLFFPALCSLLKVYACTRAADDADIIDDLDYDDSYFDGDCNLKCWQGQHLVYLTVVTGVGLCSCLVTMAWATSWLSLSKSYTVRGTLKYYCLRTCFEVCLAAIANSRLPANLMLLLSTILLGACALGTKFTSDFINCSHLTHLIKRCSFSCFAISLTLSMGFHILEGPAASAVAQLSVIGLMAYACSNSKQSIFKMRGFNSTAYSLFWYELDEVVPGSAPIATLRTNS